MWQLSVRELGCAVHPRGALVEIISKDGSDELVVEVNLLANGTIPVAFLGELHGFAYVELPSSTMHGVRRLWVDKGCLRQIEIKPSRERSSQDLMTVRFATQPNHAACRMGRVDGFD